MRYKLFNKAYTHIEGKPYVYMFCRDENGKREVFTTTMRPYFYTTQAPQVNYASVNGKSIYFDFEPAGIPSIRGDKLWKITCKSPSHVSKLREIFKPHFEADVLYPDRVLIDKGIRAVFEIVGNKMIPTDDLWIPPSVAVIDIETRVAPGVDKKPDIAKPNMILAVTIWINGDLITLQATNTTEEKKLLKEFIRLIIEKDPDYISGWNVDFDIVGILKRCDFLEIDYQDISPMGWAEVRGTNNGYKAYIPGRCVFDALGAFRKFFQGKTFDSYKLDDVAADPEYGLDWGYEPYDYVNEMNEKFIDKIVPYNQDDVMKTVGIIEKWELIRHYETVRAIVGCDIDRAVVPAQFIDILMLREFHNKFVLPSKIYGRESEDYGGGYVKQPPKGVFENIMVLDFSAMYPTIIQRYNLSPETMVGPEYDGPVHELNGYRFKKEPEGIVPKVFKELITYRKRVKKQLKKEKHKENIDTEKVTLLDKLQYALKQLINAIYGVFAYVNFRAYTLGVSSTTTYCGREDIKSTIELLEALGYVVIYTDTDSVFTISLIKTMDQNNLTDEEKEKIVAEGEGLVDIINEKFTKDAANEGSSLASAVGFETAAQRIVFIAKPKGKRKFEPVKKRYAFKAMWMDGIYTDKVVIKGFEVKRSDSAITSRNIQQKLLLQLLDGATESSIRELISESVESFKNEPLENLAIPQRITKPIDDFDEHSRIKLFLWANEHLNMQLGEGDRILKVAVKRMPPKYPGRMSLKAKGKKGTFKMKMYKIEEVPLIEGKLPEGFTDDMIDYATQTEKVIKKKVEKILTAANLSWSEIISKQKQTGMKQWF